MDFFGILFDMKNGKKIPYSKNYFDTLFAENLAGVTTLTGTLPLTFTTSETKLRSWTIYGADIEHVETASGKSITFHTDEDKLRDWTIYGNDNVGKNKFETPNISENWYTVKWRVENGVLKGVGKYNESAPHTRPRLQGQLPAGSYILSGSPDYTTTNIRLQIGTCTDSRGNNFAILGYDEGSGFSFTLQADSWVSVRVWTDAALYQQAIDVSIPIMIRPADTSADFEPYQIGIGQRTNNGYIVPLSVNGNTVNIPIGNAPLTEGQSVSKTSTGVDIATADGNNTITTTLYNQPDMSITYNEFTGVGILTANLFMIALQLKAGGQTLNVFDTLMNKPLRAGETLTSEQTGQTINTVAGVENKLSPAPKAASYGGSFNMTIKYKE